MNVMEFMRLTSNLAFERVTMFTGYERRFVVVLNETAAATSTTLIDTDTAREISRSEETK